MPIHPKENLNLLKAGILLTVFYTDKKNIRKYKHIMHGSWLSFLFPTRKYNKEKVYDICFKKIFNLEKHKIEITEYPLLPDNVEFNDLAYGNVTLFENQEYIKNLKEKINFFKDGLQQEYKKHFLNLKKEIDYNDIDLYILRFYPYQPKNKKQIIKDLKKDINEKYFIAPNQEEAYKENPHQEAVSLIPAFSLFGVSEKNINVEDSVFLNALKRKWFSLIQKEKNNMIQNFEKMDISFMSDIEKNEFKKEFEELKTELNKISIKELDDCKTPKEVIRYWPPLLQPEPAYVYGY